MWAGEKHLSKSIISSPKPATYPSLQQWLAPALPSFHSTPTCCFLWWLARQRVVVVMSSRAAAASHRSSRSLRVTRAVAGALGCATYETCDGL